MYQQIFSDLTTNLMITLSQYKFIFIKSIAKQTDAKNQK